MTITRGKIEATLTGKITVTDIKKSKVVIEFNGQNHVLREGQSLDLRLSMDYNVGD